MRDQFSASAMAAAWIAQLRHYASALAQDPAHHESWLWRIRIKVLMYLIWRYGEDPYLDLKSRREQPPVSTQLPVFSGVCNRPRSRSELRTILNRIAELNLCRQL